MKLRDYAYARTGDKGNHINIGIIPKTAKQIKAIDQILTIENISKSIDGYKFTDIKIDYYPNLKLYNIVIYDILNGGVSVNSRIDRHGKSIGDIILEIEA